MRVRTGTRWVHGAVGASAQHHGGGPAAVVEARSVPPDRLGRTVDVLREVDQVALEVPLGTREPGPPGHPPRSVGDHPLDASVPAVDDDLGHHPGLAGRMALGRSLPVGQDAHGVDRTGTEQSGEVEGLVVLGVRVAVGLALPGPLAVDVQLVLLVAGDIGAGPVDGPHPEHELATGVGVLVGLLGLVLHTTDPRGRPPPAGQSRLEGGDRRGGTGSSRGVPGLHGPAVGGIRGQCRPGIGYGGLVGRDHLAAVPDHRRRTGTDHRARHHDPVGLLSGSAPRIP